MVDGIGTRLEIVDDGVERLGALDRLEHEGRDALDRDVDEDAEGAEPGRDGGEHFGVLGLGDRQQVAVGRDEGRGDDLAGDAAEARPGAVRAG